MVEIIDDYEIQIDNDILKITNDAIELVEFVDKSKILDKKILEIGFGCGYISLKLLKYSKNIYAIDIQKQLYDLFKMNLEKNSIKDIKIDNIDFMDIDEKFDIIITNPPYYKLNSGKLPDNNIKLISKFEKHMNLEDLIHKISKILNKNGIFYMVHIKNRYDEILGLLEKYGLKVINKKESKKLIFLEIVI